MSEYAALVGIDWSDSKHDICLVEPQTLRREASVLRHASEAINEWATALRARFPDSAADDGSRCDIDCQRFEHLPHELG